MFKKINMSVVMRDFNSNPLAVIAPALESSKASQSILKEEILNFESEKDYIYYITHKVNNVRHDNGRIYLKIKDGVLVANSVSPYSEKFLDNIEEKIKPLVEALHKKRYLTYSSCMGHDYTYRRYVGLAFCSEESRQYVADQINSLGVLGVKVVLKDTVANNHVTAHERTNKPIINKLTQNSPVDYESEAASFNIQFHRNYERYYFLEIVILDEISFKNEGFTKELKKTFWKIVKKFWWDKLTQKVVNHIASNNFKKYPY